ncbi:hypothetical protein, partial [Mesorhizobium sp. M1406]|uniref:hypothetical protein n=1 Tax=Mesorhizobium sp. M1406 TaxID=2957099 RepID=UPI00333D1E88
WRADEPIIRGKTVTYVSGSNCYPSIGWTREFTKTAGLRACDKAHPCREDYICTAGYDDLVEAKAGKGTCIPPYFIFQFRVDGHPRSWVQDVRE